MLLWGKIVGGTGLQEEQAWGVGFGGGHGVDRGCLHAEERTGNDGHAHQEFRQKEHWWLWWLVDETCETGIEKSQVPAVGATDRELVGESQGFLNHGENDRGEDEENCGHLLHEEEENYQDKDLD